MIRRVFFASLFGLFAPFSALAQRRKRKPKVRPKPAVRQSETQPNLIEKAQLLASFDDDQIRTALNVRFLGLYSEEELRAELAAREIRRRKHKQ